MVWWLQWCVPWRLKRVYCLCQLILPGWYSKCILVYWDTCSTLRKTPQTCPLTMRPVNSNPEVFLLPEGLCSCPTKNKACHCCFFSCTEISFRWWFSIFLHGCHVSHTQIHTLSQIQRSKQNTGANIFNMIRTEYMNDFCQNSIFVNVV